MADIIVSSWLDICTSEFASWRAQWNVQIFDKEKTLVEVVKYCTKHFTKLDPNSKNNSSNPYIFTAAMYNIINAMKRIRTFDRFGFNLPKESRKKSQKTEVRESMIWEYDPIVKDWLNTKEQRLTGFTPSNELLNLLMNNLDNELS